MTHSEFINKIIIYPLLHLIFIKGGNDEFVLKST